MNPTLRFAHKEIRKIKLKEDESQPDSLVITVDFNQNENNMHNLYGYPAFEKALQELGGEHTEENILKACEISGLSRGSVSYDKTVYEPIVIRVQLPKR